MSDQSYNATDKGQKPTGDPQKEKCPHLNNKGQPATNLLPHVENMKDTMSRKESN